MSDRQGAAAMEAAVLAEFVAEFCKSAADSPCSSRADRIALHRPMAATARRSCSVLLAKILFGDNEEADVPGWWRRRWMCLGCEQRGGRSRAVEEEDVPGGGGGDRHGWVMEEDAEADAPGNGGGGGRGWAVEEEEADAVVEFKLFEKDFTTSIGGGLRLF